LQAGNDHPWRGTGQITVPAQAAQLIDHLRTSGITLTYDPCSGTLRMNTEEAVTGSVG
jgi:hypothetical protein